MHWPIEWLWIAVIVSVVSLLLVGFIMGRSAPPEGKSGAPSPTRVLSPVEGHGHPRPPA
jgi:hypothetical protein